MENHRPDGPDKDELPELMRHVRYEVNSFRAAVSKLLELDNPATRSPGEDRDVSTRNAWIHSLGVSARNLIDFFGTDPSKDDVVAVDYVPTWTQAEGGPELERLLDWKKVLNKRLNHITAYRIRQPSHTDIEEVTEIGFWIEAVFSAWWEQLTEEQQHWFVAPGD